MAETHELRLKIDAAAAESGARKFTAAINAVKQAVRDLDKDTTGAFTKLKSVRPDIDVTPLTRATTATDKLTSASDKAAATIQRTALASASALRTSEQAAQRLALRMGDLGDARGIAQLEAALQRMRMSLTNATSTLDVRAAKSQFDDLRSSLLQTTVAAEYARGEQAQLAREMEEASRAAAAHGETLDRLRAKYNPLYAASKQYESALEEISFAEREGAISAQMAAQARERATAQLGAASAAADQYSSAMQRGAAATQQGVMVGHQLSDVLITSQMGFQSVGMIALQQGSQLAAQMNSLKAAGGGVFRTLLSGFTSLINPLSLITIGAVAAGAAIAKFLFNAGEETKSFSDALSDANSRINELRSATDALAGNNLADLRRQYGEVNAELDAHLERLRKVAELEAGMANADMIRSIRDSLVSDGNPFTIDVDAVRRAFSTTSDQARVFLRMMRDIENARTFEQQAEAVTRLRAAVESTTGGLDKSEGAAKGVLTQLVRAEDAALRLLAAQNGVTGATDSASGAASNLTYTIGTAADEAARLLANLNSVPSALAVMGKSVEGQIASIRAQNSALNLQISEGLSAQAANRRVQLQTMISTAQERGQRITPDQIAAEWKAIEELDAAAQEQAALRKKLSEMNRPARKARGGGGGSRAAALTEEQKAIESLNSSLQDRLNGLQSENLAMQHLASGTVETTAAAQALAEAQIAMGGAVDGQTLAMVRQIDAAARLNEELQKVAKDPVKEWMDSVPNRIEAGQQIEMGAINHVRDAISEMIQTGTFDIEALGEAILGTVADIVADKAVAELANVFGRAEGDGLGGVLGGLFSSQGDGAQVAQGGVQAGQSISAAMLQAGQTVSAQLSAAMTQAGSQAGVTQQQAIAAGGTTAANAQRLAGVQHGQQVRLATTTAGSQHASQVSTAITTAGQQHASMVGAASAGGGGGGFLSGLGGWQGVLSMALGAFDVGGVSTAPANFTTAPVSAFRNAPHFSQGTPNTSGIPAILHPNEAVIPLSKGRKIPVEMGDAATGGQVLNYAPTYNIQTPDADSFRKSQKQVASEGFSAAQRAAANNR